MSAKSATLGQPSGVAVGPDGATWVSDATEGRVYRLRSPLPEGSVGDVVIPSEDGGSAFVFDEKGRHLRTVETLTGTTVITFGYDVNGRLISATDAYDNVVKLARDASGHATTAPFGQVTKLGYGADGYLASVNDPLTRTTSLTYDAGGLLTKLVDPRQGVHTMSYDTTGLLAKDAGPAGASWSFSRKEDASGYAVTVTTTAGVQRTHQGAATAPGEEARSVKHADGTTTSWTKQDAGRETTMGDGTVVTTELAPDDRFGTLTPYA